MSNTVIFARDEIDLIAAFAGCSLDSSPGSNWVEDEGGLPEYICVVARAILRGGKSKSSAIAIAVSRMKKWAAGVGVDKDTQAKATKALAEWEAMRAKRAAKKAGKKAVGKGGDKDRDKVKASNVDRDVLVLARAVEYPVSIVQTAFRTHLNAKRDAYRTAHPESKWSDGPPYYYVREQWTTFLIVDGGYDERGKQYKIPYTVDAKLNVEFGDPTEVKTQYVAVPEDEVDDTGLSDLTLSAIANASPAGCMFTGPAQLLAAGGTALDRVLKFARPSTED